MKRFLLLLLMGTNFAYSGEQRESSPDRKRFEVSVETAQLFNIDKNPNRYYFSTQMISLAWEPFSSVQLGPVQIRTQFISTIFVSSILSGPESFYLGWGPQFRTIIPLGTSSWAFYFGGGGGLGYADANPSAKHDYGLGQQFTFILLASSGIRYAFTDRWSVWAGITWQHLSNADLSEPRKENIGIDELGATLGVGWIF